MNQLKVNVLPLFITLIIGFTAVKTLQSQDISDATAKPSAATSSLLWKIEGNDLVTPSYLFGTIHMISQADFFLTEEIRKAVSESQQIVLELDMDDPQMQMTLMQGAGMKEGMTLDKLLSKEDYEKLDQLVKETLGTGIAPFNTWQPLLASSLLISRLIDGPPASYEGSLVQMAKEGEKEVLGLETVQEQLDAMGAIPYEIQASFVSEMINDMDKAKMDFASLVEAYKKQDVEKLYQLISAQIGGRVFAESMLIQRNKNWIGRIGKFAKDKATFFAVGSGHLGGETGVIKLLQKAGYTITPI